MGRFEPDDVMLMAWMVALVVVPALAFGEGPALLNIMLLAILAVWRLI